MKVPILILYGQFLSTRIHPSSFPRHGKRGGGIAFLHKIGFALTTRKCTKSATFECFEAVITNKTSSICLVAVYCPGKHTCSVKNYMADFATLLEHHSTSSAKTVMLGDFIIRVDAWTDPNHRLNIRLFNREK